MPTSLIVQFLTGFGLLACALSFWKGGTPERVGSLLVAASILFSLFGAAMLSSAVFPLAQMIGDALIAVGLLLVTLKYGSPWLGVAMLLYAAQFALHAYYFVMERPIDLFHATVNNLNFLGVILCVVAGAISVLVRRSRAAQAARTVSPA